MNRDHYIKRYKKENNLKRIVALKNQDIDSMRQLQKSSPNNLSLKFEFAKLLLSKGEEHYEEASNLLCELLETKNKRYAMLELGKLEIKKGNLKEAKDYFELLLSKWEDAYARLELGKIEYDLKNFEKAKYHFEQVLKEKNDPLVLFQLARTEKKLDNISKARIHFDAVSKTVLDANIKPSALLELGKLEAEEGNLDKARKIFKDLANQNVPYANKALIMLEYRNGNYLEAIKLINEELKNGETVDEKIILALSKELNIFFDIDYNEIPLTYLNKQILDYDEYTALSHIIDRHVNGVNSFNFNKKLDIYELFYETKSMLARENKIKNLVFNDVYVIPYQSIGEVGEEYLRVVTLPDSKNIITMYPMFTEYDEETEDMLDFKKKLIKRFQKISKK